MMGPRTWRQLAGKKSEDVVQEWLFLKVAGWELLCLLVREVSWGYRVLWPRAGHYQASG